MTERLQLPDYRFLCLRLEIFTVKKIHCASPLVRNMYSAVTSWLLYLIVVELNIVNKVCMHLIAPLSGIVNKNSGCWPKKYVKCSVSSSSKMRHRSLGHPHPETRNIHSCCWDRSGILVFRSSKYLDLYYFTSGLWYILWWSKFLFW